LPKRVVRNKGYDDVWNEGNWTEQDHLGGRRLSKRVASQKNDYEDVWKEGN
jgi:hypothetical protein